MKDDAIKDDYNSLSPPSEEYVLTSIKQSAWQKASNMEWSILEWETPEQVNEKSCQPIPQLSRLRASAEIKPIQEYCMC